MELERHADVALLRMNGGKANAIDATFLSRMAALLDEVQSSGARALVVTGTEQFFCAGLDLPHLLPLSRAGIEAFLEQFNALVLRLFNLPLPMVAAVNGHAIAGGCVLALQADVRIMAEGKARIGLSEVPLGLGLPLVVIETLRSQVPLSSLLPIALEGKLLLASEALALGLVHEVAPTGHVLDRALARAQELALLPASSFAQVKASLRRPAIDAIRARSVEDRGAWVELWFSPSGQQGVRAAVARLQKKA